MIKYVCRFAAAAAVLALVAGAVVASPAAASDGADSDEAEVDEWSPGGAASDGDEFSGDYNKSSWWCFFTGEADEPHRSGADVSVHGTWHEWGWSFCPEFARVTVWLQKEVCSTPYWCQWVNRGYSSSKVVREGGGRGNRATARVACDSNQLTKWRGVVDVDILGYNDDPALDYGPEAWVACNVY